MATTPDQSHVAEGKALLAIMDTFRRALVNVIACEKCDMWTLISWGGEKMQCKISTVSTNIWDLHQKQVNGWLLHEFYESLLDLLTLKDFDRRGTNQSQFLTKACTNLSSSHFCISPAVPVSAFLKISICEDDVLGEKLNKITYSRRIMRYFSKVDLRG